MKANYIQNRTQQERIAQKAAKAGKLKNDNARWISGFEDAFVYGKGQGVILEVIQ